MEINTATPNPINLISQALPLRAHQVAIGLAAAYGHLWATRWPAQAILVAGEMGPETIAELLLRAQALAEESNAEWRPSGIEVADALIWAVGGGAMYRHRTGSGRLVWEVKTIDVHADGTDAVAPENWVLDLEVHRPAVRIGDNEYPEGVAIMARFTPEKGWNVWHGQGVGDNVPFYDRHVESLKEALNAVSRETEPFPADKIEELERYANGHVATSAKLLAQEFVRQYGLEAAKGVEGLFAELGEQAFNVRGWCGWPTC